MSMVRPIVKSVVLLAVLGASTAIISDVYRWVDDDGIEHYGNKPHPTLETTRVSSYDSSKSIYEEPDPFQQVLDKIDQAFNSGDFEKALTLLTPLAESGHYRAQNGMGVIFDRGLGVAQDLSKAAEWYQLSAAQGYAKAQFNIAVMYANGEGVDQDLEHAAKWYGLAAEQDHAFAQHNLAQMYLKGNGLERDLLAALKWETSAAESGDANAQYSLGLMYYGGRVVPKDGAIAYKWISRALSNGYPFTLKLPTGWIVGHHAYDQQKSEILEFVRSDESVDDWSELITVQRMPTTWGRATPKATLENLKSIREETCPGTTTWRTLDSTDTSVTFEWQAYPCGGWPDQHEISKIIYRPADRIFIHYAVKHYSMPEPERSEWITRLSSAI